MDWRRQYAAGYRQMGGRIKYISKAENTAVEKQRKAIYKNRKPRHSLSAGTIQTLAICKGRTTKGPRSSVVGKDFRTSWQV